MTYPFIQARHYTAIPETIRTPRIIVVHVEENDERPGTAVGVANWFHRGVDGTPLGMKKPASAHYVTDADRIIQCVLEKDEAWAAPGANTDGIHIEGAGRSSQSPAQWHDDYSRRMLENHSKVAAEAAARWAIPLRRLSVAEVRDRKTRGFCGHVDVSKAFGLSDHYDPGPDFPWEDYMALVRDAFGPPLQEQP